MPPVVISFRALALLHDVARCLAWADQGLLPSNAAGRAPASALARLNQRISWSAILPPERAERSARVCFLLGLLKQAELLRPGQVSSGPAYMVASAGEDWLVAPPAQQLRALLTAWQHNPDPTWGWLPSERGRSRKAYWRRLVQATTRKAQALSPTLWTPFPEFYAALLEEFLLSGEVAFHLPAVRQGQDSRTRKLLRFLLLEVLPALGLMELQDREGIAWLRPIPASPDDPAPLAKDAPKELAVELGSPDDPLASGRLTVDADLTISVPLDAPAACTFELERWAEWLAPDAPAQPIARYHLAHAMLEKALARGNRLADVRLLLTRFAAAPLPEAVNDWLEQAERDLIGLTCEPGYRLRALSEAPLAGLRQRRFFRQHTYAGGSAREAWVSLEDAEILWRWLRREGQVVIPQPLARHPTAGLPAQRLGLPGVPLVVALGTYRLLRQALPGLADLPVGPIEDLLKSALSPEERKGAERLLASHAALLAPRRSPSASESAPEPLSSAGLFERLATLIAAGQAITLRYVDTQGRVTERIVQPFGIVTRGDRSYLRTREVAGSDSDNSATERHFRLDRIIQVATLSGPLATSLHDQ